MKNIFILFSCLYAYNGISQIDANALLGLPNASSSEITGINTATIQEGALVFDSDKKRVYEFDGIEWRELLIAPSVFEKTGNYTLVVTDNLNILTFNSATDITLTVPAGLPVGFNVSVYQIGNGKVTIVGAGGATIRNRLSRFKTAGQDAGVGIVCTATNVFHVTGDLKRD